MAQVTKKRLCGLPWLPKDNFFYKIIEWAFGKFVVKTGYPVAKFRRLAFGTLQGVSRFVGFKIPLLKKCRNLRVAAG